MIVWCWESFVVYLSPVAGEQPPSAALRAALAALSSLLLVLIIGPKCIRLLGRRFGERVASPSADIQRLHAHKTSTPTMGGLFVLAALLLSVAMFADWRNSLVWLAMFVLLGFGVVGVVDDLQKLSGKRRGLSARGKLLGQFAVGIVVALMLYVWPGVPSSALSLDAQAVAGPVAWTSLFGAMLMLLIVAGSSNAVNLTDGLDGLAGGCLACSFASLGLVALARGEPDWSVFLGLAPVPGAQEMAVIAAAAFGAVVGFLWFNAHPAAVFMGDTGALSLGALLGFVAVAARAELLLAIMGGVFVVEALSVMLQVASFRATGRRIFLCAPLHHHFQLCGWTEHKIVTRFWIVAALCGGAGLLAALAEAHVGKSHPSPLAVTRRGG